MRYDAGGVFIGWEVLSYPDGAKIDAVMWIDTGSNTYGVAEQPFRVVGDSVAVDVHIAAAIAVDMPARTFWITRPSLCGLPQVPTVLAQPRECEECTDAGRCSRVNQCLRFKCGFGEVAKP